MGATTAPRPRTPTAARAALLDALDAAGRPLTVAEAHAALGPAAPTPGTVRRHLLHLAATGEVAEGVRPHAGPCGPAAVATFATHPEP